MTLDSNLFDENKIFSFLELKNLNQKTDLCEIFYKYGCWKGLLGKESDPGWHNYSPLYDYLFKHLRDRPINIFEVGIYHGDSVKSWIEYFPKSQIYVGDVDLSLFAYVENFDNVHCFYCDQDNPQSIQNMWQSNDLKNLEFDIIMDDGKHEFSSNINFFKESIYKLKKGGIFIIEDLTFSTVNSFENIIQELQNTYSLDFIKLMNLPHDNNHTDNNLLVIIK